MEHEGCNPLSRLLVKCRDGMRVGVHRDRHGGVPQALRYGLGVNPGLEGEGRVGVTEIVRPNAGEPRFTDSLVKGSAEVLWVDRLSILACKRPA